MCRTEAEALGLPATFHETPQTTVKSANRAAALLEAAALAELKRVTCDNITQGL